MDSESIAPAVLTFNSLINACSKAGDISRAEHWLSEMCRRGFAPDGISYSTVINACIAAQQLERAEKLLEDMHSRCHHGATTANAFCYNLVIQALARRGDVEKAVQWLTSAISVGAAGNAGAYSNIIGTYTKTGQLEQADRWLAQMVSSKLILPTNGSVGCPGHIAAAWERRGQNDRAAATWRLASGAQTGRPGQAMRKLLGAVQQT